MENAIRALPGRRLAAVLASIAALALLVTLGMRPAAAARAATADWSTSGTEGPPGIPTVDAQAVRPWLWLPIIYPPAPPAAPWLKAIDNADADAFYSVSWTASPDAAGYVLQEATAASFGDARAVYDGRSTVWTVPSPGKTPNKYYYRVRAYSARGMGAWSNTQLLQLPALFVGLKRTFEGHGYIRQGSADLTVGDHETTDCNRLIDPDTLRCEWALWYDPNPESWPTERWTSDYSIASGAFKRSSLPADPAWKWGTPWRLPYGSAYQDGEIISIDNQRFRVSGPLSGVTAFGRPVRYYEMVNVDAFLMWDDGGDWQQYVAPGEAMLRFEVGKSELLLYQDVLRRYYYRGSATADTVQYVDKLTMSNSFPSSIGSAGPSERVAPPGVSPRPAAGPARRP